MRTFFIFIALFLLPLFSYGSLDVTIPTGKKARLRLVESMLDGQERKNVLVPLAEIPEGSLVSIPELRPQMFQWVLNDLGKIIQSTMPYFVVRVREIAEPNEIPAEIKARILSEPFYVHIRDMNTGLIVSRLFPENLPPGVEKIEGNFLWNEFNPNGTWAHSIRLGLEKSVNVHLLRKAPRDIVDFCPRYFSLSLLEKEKFWIALLNEIGKFESAFIPHTASDEGRYDPSSKGVISSGITQISIRSSKQECYQARGCRAIRNQSDLYHPERNLSCAIGIMSCLAERDSCVSCKSGNWQGIARYWSTLRDPYEVNCSICPGGKITIGKKPAIKESLKVTASFCH
jgi:hypothetical protein